MSYMKDARSGAVGNTRLLGKYGGGSSGPRQAYANGGAVKARADGGPAMAEGISASGSPAKPSLARPSRKVGKGKAKGKDGKTHINVIVAPQSGASPGGPAPGPGPMAGPPPGPPPPMPMPPPGAGPGGPPMPPPMRAKGGVVYRKKGGRVGTAECRSVGGPASPPKGFDAGAGGGKGRMEKIKKYGK